MSPTIFRVKDYRFFFFSREELRRHVHVSCSDGEAKFWLEPKIELAKNYNLKAKQLKIVEKLIVDNYDKINDKWNQFFS